MPKTKITTEELKDENLQGTVWIGWMFPLDFGRNRVSEIFVLHCKLLERKEDLS